MKPFPVILLKAIYLVNIYHYCQHIQQLARLTFFLPASLHPLTAVYQKPLPPPHRSG